MAKGFILRSRSVSAFPVSLATARTHTHPTTVAGQTDLCTFLYFDGETSEWKGKTPHVSWLNQNLGLLIYYSIIISIYLFIYLFICLSISLLVFYLHTHVLYIYICVYIYIFIYAYISMCVWWLNVEVSCVLLPPRLATDLGTWIKGKLFLFDWERSLVHGFSECGLVIFMIFLGYSYDVLVGSIGCYLCGCFDSVSGESLGSSGEIERLESNICMMRIRRLSFEPEILKRNRQEHSFSKPIQ